MRRSSIERRLARATSQLKQARIELAVLDEQLVAFVDTADDARVRALVSDNPADGQEHRQASRHADAMARSRSALASTITELERHIDELLEDLTPSSSS